MRPIQPSLRDLFNSKLYHRRSKRRAIFDYPYGIQNQLNPMKTSPLSEFSDRLVTLCDGHVSVVRPSFGNMIEHFDPRY